MWTFYEIQFSASLNKDLLEHSHMHPFMYCLADFTLNGRVSSWDRDLMAYKACNIYHVALCIKSFPTLALKKEWEFPCASSGRWVFGCLSSNYSSFNSCWVYLNIPYSQSILFEWVWFSPSTWPHPQMEHITWAGANQLSTFLPEQSDWFMRVTWINWINEVFVRASKRETDAPSVRCAPGYTEMGTMQASSDNEALDKEVKTGDFESRTKPNLVLLPFVSLVEPMNFFA